MRRHIDLVMVPVLLLAAFLALSGAFLGCGDGHHGNGNFNFNGNLNGNGNFNINGNDNNNQAECGNGVIDSGERCDDGNHHDGDGCSRHCLIECGSGSNRAECTVGEFCCANGTITECRALGQVCPQ